MITYVAEYCTSMLAGWPWHVAGALPPAVLSLYTSLMPPVAPSLARSFNHGTALEPEGPFAAVAGAAAVLFLEVGTVPMFRAGVSRLKKGVVLLTKKWWPEMGGGGAMGPSDPTELTASKLKLMAMAGIVTSRSELVAATQLALKRVATAPTATGAELGLLGSHV